MSVGEVQNLMLAFNSAVIERARKVEMKPAPGLCAGQGQAGRPAQ